MPDLNPVQHAFQLLKTKINAESPINKQQLKVAIALAGHLKGWKTEHFGMSMGSRLQAFISEDKGISSKSVHINYVSLV